MNQTPQLIPRMREDEGCPCLPEFARAHAWTTRSFISTAAQTWLASSLTQGSHAHASSLFALFVPEGDVVKPDGLTT
jgi:hypothetical protein